MIARITVDIDVTDFMDDMNMTIPELEIELVSAIEDGKVFGSYGGLDSDVEIQIA